eukprot:TRINITY_DN7501_c0_g1_i1.p2 TRINITY_DN7501_c0_g1~~TRINITY_DN7501_c0_g1_i1.p2  ORF type:complete len:105 (-),score=29.68 TRINITY_DN7501_c0_g1_i1:10-324(-)
MCIRDRQECIQNFLLCEECLNGRNTHKDNHDHYIEDLNQVAESFSKKMKKLTFSKSPEKMLENVDNYFDHELSMIKSKWETNDCLLYTSPSPRDRQKSRMPSSA